MIEHYNTRIASVKGLTFQDFLDAQLKNKEDKLENGSEQLRNALFISKDEEVESENNNKLSNSDKTDGPGELNEPALGLMSKSLELKKKLEKKVDKKELSLKELNLTEEEIPEEKLSLKDLEGILKLKVEGLETKLELILKAETAVREAEKLAAKNSEDKAYKPKKRTRNLKKSRKSIFGNRNFFGKRGKEIKKKETKTNIEETSEQNSIEEQKQIREKYKEAKEKLMAAIPEQVSADTTIPSKVDNEAQSVKALKRKIKAARIGLELEKQEAEKGRKVLGKRIKAYKVVMEQGFVPKEEEDIQLYGAIQVAQKAWVAVTGGREGKKWKDVKAEESEITVHDEEDTTKSSQFVRKNPIVRLWNALFNNELEKKLRKIEDEKEIEKIIDELPTIDALPTEEKDSAYLRRLTSDLNTIEQQKRELETEIKNREGKKSKFEEDGIYERVKALGAIFDEANAPSRFWRLRNYVKHKLLWRWTKTPLYSSMRNKFDEIKEDGKKAEETVLRRIKILDENIIRLKYPKASYFLPESYNAGSDFYRSVLTSRGYLDSEKLSRESWQLHFEEELDVPTIKKVLRKNKEYRAQQQQRYIQTIIRRRIEDLIEEIENADPLANIDDMVASEALKLQNLLRSGKDITEEDVSETGLDIKAVQEEVSGSVQDNTEGEKPTEEEKLRKLLERAANIERIKRRIASLKKNNGTQDQEKVKELEKKLRNVEREIKEKVAKSFFALDILLGKYEVKDILGNYESKKSKDKKRLLKHKQKLDNVINKNEVLPTVQEGKLIENGGALHIVLKLGEVIERKKKERKKEAKKPRSRAYSTSSVLSKSSVTSAFSTVSRRAKDVISYGYRKVLIGGKALNEAAKRVVSAGSWLKEKLSGNKIRIEEVKSETTDKQKEEIERWKKRIQTLGELKELEIARLKRGMLTGEMSEEEQKSLQDAIENLEIRISRLEEVQMFQEEIHHGQYDTRTLLQKLSAVKQGIKQGETSPTTQGYLQDVVDFLEKQEVLAVSLPVANLVQNLKEQVSLSNFEDSHKLMLYDLIDTITEKKVKNQIKRQKKLQEELVEKLRMPGRNTSLFPGSVEGINFYDLLEKGEINIEDDTDFKLFSRKEEEKEISVNELLAKNVIGDDIGKERELQNKHKAILRNIQKALKGELYEVSVSGGTVGNDTSKAEAKKENLKKLTLALVHVLKEEELKGRAKGLYKKLKKDTNLLVSGSTFPEEKLPYLEKLLQSLQEKLAANLKEYLKNPNSNTLDIEDINRVRILIKNVQIQGLTLTQKAYKRDRKSEINAAQKKLKIEVEKRRQRNKTRREKKKIRKSQRLSSGVRSSLKI